MQHHGPLRLVERAQCRAGGDLGDVSPPAVAPRQHRLSVAARPAVHAGADERPSFRRAGWSYSHRALTVGVEEEPGRRAHTPLGAIEPGTQRRVRSST